MIAALAGKSYGGYLKSWAVEEVFAHGESQQRRRGVGALPRRRPLLHRRGRSVLQIRRHYPHRAPSGSPRAQVNDPLQPRNCHGHAFHDPFVDPGTR